jgi:hypothetical protein
MRKTGSFYYQMVGFYENGDKPADLKLCNFLTAAVITRMCKYGVGPMYLNTLLDIFRGDTLPLDLHNLKPISRSLRTVRMRKIPRSCKAP